MQIIKGKQKRPQRVVIYGVEGIGKSTLASYAPAPLFLDTENGSAQLDVDRVNVRTLGDIREVYEMLTTASGQYKTLVLDTADNLYRLCADSICAEYKKTNIEEFGYGKGYAMTAERFREVLTCFDNLAHAGYHIVIISHAKVTTISPPDTAEYSKYCIKVCAPQKQAEASRELLKEWCDALLFCRYDICVNQQDKKAVGENRRVVATTSAPAWEAKNRLGLPESMPMGPEVILRALQVDLNDLPTAPAPQAAPMPAPVPTQNAEPQPDTAAEEDELLLAYFRESTRVLGPEDTLEQLPPRIKQALQVRRADALARAREWKNKQ